MGTTQDNRIISQIDQKIITAVKAGNINEATTWRSLKSALHNEEIRLGHPLNEAESQTVIKQEHKKRREAEAEYRKALRDDLSQKEAFEAQLLEQFLPKQLSESEIETLVKSTIDELGGGSPADLGKVMASVMKKVAGQADGAMVSRIAQRLLS